MILLCVQTGLSLAISPFFVVYVATNNAWFGGKPQTLAICELVFFAGMVAASLYVGRLNLRKPGLCFIFGTAIVGISVLLMAFSRIFAVFVFWNLVAGLAVPFADIPVRTWMQSTVPDIYRGRVNSVYTMLQAGTQPVGLCLGGLIVAQAGIEWAFIGMGGGMALAACAGLLDRTFRKLDIAPTSASLEPETALALEG